MKKIKKKTKGKNVEDFDDVGGEYRRGWGDF